MGEVVELTLTSLEDVVACIEGTLAALKAGEYGKVTCGAAVLLEDNGEPHVFGWGHTDSLHSIGILQIGAALLATNSVVR